MPQTTSAYYLPSGEWAEHSVRLFVLVILPLSAAWGYGYAHAIHVAPIQFFKIFFMVLVLVLMSMVNGSLLVKRGHIRNLKIARIFGVLSAIVFVYVYWAVWLDLAFGSHDELRAHPAATAYLEASPHWALLLIRPDLLWPLIVAVFETGTWGFFNFDGDRILTGTPLAVLWLAEISLFVSALPDNFTKYVRKPYCEAVGDWFEEGNSTRFSLWPMCRAGNRSWNRVTTAIWCPCSGPPTTRPTANSRCIIRRTIRLMTVPTATGFRKQRRWPVANRNIT
jgi:hypothetical protein